MDSGREIYAMAHTYPTQVAHWALWIPRTNNHSLGKIIHVAGNMDLGFELELKRNYDKDITTSAKTILPIGRVPTTHKIFDDFADGETKPKAWKADKAWGEKAARDELEGVAKLVRAPPGREEQWAAKEAELTAEYKKHHGEINEKETEVLKKEAQAMPFKNCQTWLVDYVALLVHNGFLPQEANEALKHLPKDPTGKK